MVKRIQLSIMCHVSPLVTISSISPLLSSSQLDLLAVEICQLPKMSASNPKFTIRFVFHCDTEVPR